MELICVGGKVVVEGVLFGVSVDLIFVDVVEVVFEENFFWCDEI